MDCLVSAYSFGMPEGDNARVVGGHAVICSHVAILDIRLDTDAFVSCKQIDLFTLFCRVKIYDDFAVYLFIAEGKGDNIGISVVIQTQPNRLTCVQNGQKFVPIGNFALKFSLMRLAL